VSETPQAEQLLAPVEPQFRDELEYTLRSGVQLIGIESHEELFAVQCIRLVAKAEKLQMPVIEWDLVGGWSNESKSADEIDRDYTNALQMLENRPGSKYYNQTALFVFKDLNFAFRDKLFLRQLRSLYANNDLCSSTPGHMRPLIFLAPQLDIPTELSTCMTKIEFPLPTREQLDHGAVQMIQDSIAGSYPERAALSDELRSGIVHDLQGLTMLQAIDAVSAGVTREEGFQPGVRTLIKREKAKAVANSGLLSFTDPDTLPPRNEIGGYGELLKFVDRRKKAYTDRAVELNIDNPKGVVLIGPPGSGKSYVAKAIAGQMELPLYTLNFGALFRGIVGESEANVRTVIKQVTAQRGCVLLVDEADKAFAFASSSQGDSGVTRRVFGEFLTWLAEKKDQTFVVMTMNRTTGIDPEVLRAGRFDAMFSTDLPSEEERLEILKIHLRKRGVEPDELGFTEKQWQTIVAQTAEFVGAELEQVIVEARAIAFEERDSGTPSEAELLEAAGSIIPLTQMDGEAIKQIREFCQTRCRPVARPQAKKPRNKGRSISIPETKNKG